VGADVLACGRTDPRGVANSSFLATVPSRQNLRQSSCMQAFCCSALRCDIAFLNQHVEAVLIFPLQTGLLAVINKFALTNLPVCWISSFFFVAVVVKLTYVVQALETVSLPF